MEVDTAEREREWSEGASGKRCYANESERRRRLIQAGLTSHGSISTEARPALRPGASSCISTALFSTASGRS